MPKFKISWFVEGIDGDDAFEAFMNTDNIEDVYDYQIEEVATDLTVEEVTNDDETKESEDE